MRQTIANGTPILDGLTDTYDVHAYTVYVTCYFCYIFRFMVVRVASYMLFNVHLCLYIMLLRTGGGT